MWIVFGKVCQPKAAAVPGHGQVVGHVGLPKPPGYKSAPVTEVGEKRVRGGWREVLLDAQPDILGWSSCILKLQSSSDLISQYYVVNWQYPCIENVLFITKSFLKNNCCSDIDMSPQVFAMHTHLLCLKIFQLYDISDDIR